jgi:type I restriction enzyme, R subunit
MSKVEGAVLLAAAPAPGEGRSAAGTDQGEAKPATFRCHGGTGLGDAAARPGHQGLETRQRARPDLKEREPQRAALYKATVALVRAYANIADELEPAGYNVAEIDRIKQQVKHYLNVREIIRKASGETLDLKAYEADMRHLIDTYIEADEPRTISPFDKMSLLELIVKTGIADAINKQLGGLKGNKNAIAETIENNVRSKIIKEHLNDPAFYEKMSALLDEIIAARRAKAIEYAEYLKRIAELATKVEAGKGDDTPAKLDTPGKRALWNNLGQNEALALKIDATVKEVRPDGWRGVQSREQIGRAFIHNSGL